MLAFFISTFSILPGVFRNSDIGVGFLIVYWVYLVVFFTHTPVYVYGGGHRVFWEKSHDVLRSSVKEMLPRRLVMGFFDGRDVVFRPRNGARHCSPTAHLARNANTYNIPSPKIDRTQPADTPWKCFSCFSVGMEMLTVRSVVGFFSVDLLHRYCASRWWKCKMNHFWNVFALLRLILDWKKWVIW